MTTPCARKIKAGCLLAALCALPTGSQAQSGSFSTEVVTLGTGGFRLTLGVLWTCDDDPEVTAGAAGEADLLDGSGNVVAEITATVNGATPVVTVTGGGSATNITSAVNLHGSGGTPADGHLHAVWNITGPSPGPYTLRFWLFHRSVHGNPVSTITTLAMDTGGSGSVSAPTPTPTPTPTQAPPPPTVSIAAPSNAVALQAVSIGATANRPPGGNPLSSVAVSVSTDGGATWSPVISNNQPSNPSDSENASYAFAAAGGALVRAVATDTAGLSGSAVQSVAVGKAAQPSPSLSLSVSAITAGQGLAFSASGGMTGNYVWGGSASGAGSAQLVSFPSPGAYVVTVFDSGDASYNPSASATATISVQAAFFTLSLAASAGGSVAGGGSYPPNSQATAVAAPGAGSAFTGWTGDVTAAGPSGSVFLHTTKAGPAPVIPLQSQVISFVPPGAVTTHTPAFALTVSASSGLPVSLALNTGPVSLAGNVVTPAGATGQVTLTATQPGNSIFLPAPPVVISFPVGNPPAGVLIADDSPGTKKSDRVTRTTSYLSSPAH